MELTVCICTHNRPRYLADCLAGLARQTAGPQAFAILVIDSASDEAVAAQLARMVAATPNGSLIRVLQPGVSLARNTAAWACHTPYIAYIDDDAIPAADWVARILAALEEAPTPPAVLGGKVLPLWEAPLPRWWPNRLRGVLSIIEAEGQGEYGDPALPRELAPYAVNMVVNVLSLLAVGGFPGQAGRVGDCLLSDEDVQLASRLRQAGQSLRYDSRIIVHHQIQAERLQPAWLLARLYWQGASTVLTRRRFDRNQEVRRELPRRLGVALLCAPAALLPSRCALLISARWRFAYALGFIRAALGWNPAAATCGYVALTAARNAAGV